MKKQILIAIFSLGTTFVGAQTQTKDTAKVVVPQVSEETLAKMKAAEEEQRLSDSIAIAKYTKNFVESIPKKDLILITGPNMKVEYVKPTPQKKSSSKRNPTLKKSN